MANQPIDPATLYKAGQAPKKVPLIDCPGWLAAGWSYTQPAEPSEEITEVLPPEPKPEPRRSRSPKPPTD